MNSSSFFPVNSRFGAILIISLIFCIGCTLHAGIVIDDFATPQTATDSNGNTVTGDIIIGGERDVRVHKDTAQVHINSAYGSGCHVINTAGDASTGRAWFTYDGDDGDVTEYDLSGLGHMDLTGGGLYDGFLVSLEQITGDATISFYVAQSDKNGGVLVDLPRKPQNIFVPFADFEYESSSEENEELSINSLLIDFSDVGYVSFGIHLETDSSCTIGSITVVPEPATILVISAGALLLRKRK